MKKTEKKSQDSDQQNEKSLTERVAEIQAKIKSLRGDNRVPFDEKAFMDEGWEL
ncbi:MULTISPECIES: hypothetical protein [Terrabacteria group]|uniref:hypothetical protein n=1 Tax=Bacillati TaxID=1783272 RepID=UPI003668FFD5